MEKTLIQACDEAIEKANKRFLTKFVFNFEGVFYTCDFKNGVWSLPELIILV